MNLHSYTVVHYGKDYIGYALKSVYDFVDQAHILHTPHPSHGHQTDKERIETKTDIRQGVDEILETRPLALTAAGKIRWHNVNTVYQEGRQRNSAVEICKYSGADVILVVDYDEIWPEKTLNSVWEYIADNLGEARDWLFNFAHLWRSFDWCCFDEAHPVRFIDLTAPEGTIRYIPKDLGPAYHFGYAITDKLMRYKWEIHGHKNDLRPGWFKEKWQGGVGIHGWRPVEDCHPTNGDGFWNPVPFDKKELPFLMRNHPFYNLERIE